MHLLPRATPARRRVVILAAAALVVVAAGCSNPSAGRLFVADAAPDAADATGGVKIWSVDPGDELNDDTLVAEDATQPLLVLSNTEDGQPWINELGREWNGDTLLSFQGIEQSIVTAGVPGQSPEEIATSSAAQTEVLRRGALVRTADGCTLSSDATSTSDVGSGTCAISSDERWVTSWSADSGLEIRDLRNDSVSTVEDLDVVNAIPLAHDAVVLALVSIDDGFVGVVLDATDGSELGRTESFPQAELIPAEPDSTGWLLRVQGQEAVSLVHVDSDASTETIDTDQFLEPVVAGDEVTYLSFDPTAPDGAELRRWDGDDVEVLLTGNVGAGPVGDGDVIATRSTADAIEFWRPDGDDAMTKAFTLESPADTDAAAVPGAQVSRMIVRGSTVHLTVENGATGMSYVRLDLEGDGSDAPIENWPYVRIAGIDGDGTAVLTGSPDNAELQLLVASPHHDVDERATLLADQRALIHEGHIYFNAVDADGGISVATVRSSGSDDDVDTLYPEAQLAGVSWPEMGGGTESRLVSLALLVTEGQQQQAQAQAQAQAVPSEPVAGS